MFVLCTTLAASVSLPVRASSIGSVRPKAETAPLYDDEAGGDANADDPAIWRNSADPGRSLVVATAKQGGLRVYDLDAREVQSITDITDPAARQVFSADQAEINGQKTAYGLATWTDRKTGRSYAVVSRRNRTASPCWS
nr:hypothetical protein KPHV_03160 [Kitasatospora purpeofusca]